MLLDNLAGNITNILVCIVGPLRSWIAALGEAKRPAVFIEEVFLLKSEPRDRIVENDGAGIRGVRSDAIRHHDFAHDEAPFLRVVSKKIGTGFKTQSELLPSACLVELP